MKKFILHLFGYNEKGKCVAIYYHMVSDDDTSNFLHQMNLLKKLAKPVKANYTGRLDDDTVYVIVTFDDGFQSMLMNVFPYMAKLQIPCTVFIPTQYIGKHPDWDEITSRENRNRTIMSEEEIKKIPGSLFSVGAHSHSHSVLPKIPDEEAEIEFRRSKEMLESITGKEVNMFSFPYGEYDKRLAQIAFRCGYKRLFSIQYTVNYSNLENFIIGRCYVESSDSLLEFKLKILGAYKWMNSVSKIKKLIRNYLNKLSGKNKETAGPDYEFQLKNADNK